MGEGILLGPLVLFAAAVTLTPGPNVVLVTASGANFGFRRTIPQMTGITFGFGSMVIACGLGLAGLVEAEPRLHIVLKYVGSAYFLYLAWRIARADAGTGDTLCPRPIGFIEATLFTWMNPKAWVSVVGAIAAYTTVGSDVLWQPPPLPPCLRRSACFRAWSGQASARLSAAFSPIRMPAGHSTGRWRACWCFP